MIDKSTRLFLIFIASCFLYDAEGGIDKRGILSRTSMNVGNVISVMIPDTSEEDVNIDQLTNNFRRQLERIKYQNLRNKMEHGWKTLQNILPVFSSEESNKNTFNSKNEDKSLESRPKLSRSKNTKHYQENKNENPNPDTFHKVHKIKDMPEDSSDGLRELLISSTPRECLNKMCYENQSGEVDSPDSKYTIKNVQDPSHRNNEEITKEHLADNTQLNEVSAEEIDEIQFNQITKNENEIRQSLMRQLAHLKSYVSKKLRQSFPDVMKINRKRSFKHVPTNTLKVYAVYPDSLRLKRSVVSERNSYISQLNPMFIPTESVNNSSKLFRRRSPKKLKKPQYSKQTKYVGELPHHSLSLQNDFTLLNLNAESRMRPYREVKRHIKTSKQKLKLSKTLEEKNTTISSNFNKISNDEEVENSTQFTDVSTNSKPLEDDAVTKNIQEEIISEATTVLEEGEKAEPDTSTAELEANVQNKSNLTIPQIVNKNVVELGPIYPFSQINLGPWVFNVKKMYLGRLPLNSTDTKVGSADRTRSTLIIEMIPTREPHIPHPKDLSIDLQELRNIATLAATSSHNHNSDKSSILDESDEFPLVNNGILKSSNPMDSMFSDINATDLDHMSQSMNKSAKIDISTILGVRNKTFKSQISGSINATLTTKIITQDNLSTLRNTSITDKYSPDTSMVSDTNITEKMSNQEPISGVSTSNDAEDQTFTAFTTKAT